MIRKLVEYLADRYKTQDRLKYLKTTTEIIHIVKNQDFLCGAGTIYHYEEYEPEGLPYVYIFDKEELKYVTCKKCLRGIVL